MRPTLPRRAVRHLPQLGASCLRAVAKPVPARMFNTPQLDALVEDLVDTMHAANGAGIAAPQIDEPWRVFVVHGTGDNPRYPYKPAVPLTVFVNPVIEVLDDTPMHMIEGCLSVPGVRGRVQRACKVRCTAQRPDGSRFVLRAEGHVAGTLQHELDHLDARLFPDMTPEGGLMTWDGFDAYHKEAFFEYADEINEKYPTPIVWEEGGEVGAVGAAGKVSAAETSPAAAAAAVTTATTATGTDATAPAKEETVYAPGLTWLDGRFQRNVRVAVSERTGRVLRVEQAAADAPNDGVVHLQENALIPGFVNAHSHAFQRGLRGRGETYPRGDEGDETPSFWTWREAMYGLVQELGTAAAFKAQTKQCFEEMAAAGITTCGEFHYFRHSAEALARMAEQEGNGDGGDGPCDFDQLVVEAAREANVRLVLMSAFYERGGFDGAPLGPGQQRFRTSDVDAYWRQTDHVSSLLAAGGRGDACGVVLHSMRAASAPTVRRVAREAHERGLVLHVHLEEQPKEIEDCLAEHGRTPMALLLDTVDAPDHLSRCCGVHCTHSQPHELAQFLDAGGNVCVCPLTEASLGDGVFGPLEVTRGNVSLGTDCNARIDMFEEMRLIEYSQRLARGRRGALAAVGDDAHGDLARQLLDCATVHGATALGVDTGTIEAGRWADFALLDLHAPALRGATDTHMLGAAVFGGSGEGLVVDTCVAGKWTK